VALQIKTPGATLSCDLKELHDLWWNSIARAMRWPIPLTGMGR